MIRRPPRSTRTDTLFPYPTLFRSLLARADHEIIDMRTLVESQLAALGGGRDLTDGIAIDGPTVALPVRSLQALALALHELAKNAAAYGPLGQRPARSRLGEGSVSTCRSRWWAYN